MTQENKKLLLKDLCARFPYGIKASYYGVEEECETWDEIEGITLDEDFGGYVDIGQYSLPIERIKPYLFPMSSMTEEQKVIYGDLCYSIIQSLAKNMQSELNELINWLNAHHFDYRGLIEKRLAIDATNLNVY